MSVPTRGPSMALAGGDTNIMKIKQAINVDYPNTGFDRGHLNPYFYQCNNGRTATFTLTNCVPQNPCFNEQIWKAMEEQSKKIMNDFCPYPGAKRFFVTGAVPTEKRIPDESHDQEGDRRRSYNRVSVPSHMWTAACCDTTSCQDPNHRKEGFSYGYIGNNTADPYVEIFSVRELEQTLVRRYRYVHNVNFAEVFADDKCNINEEKSKKIRQKVAVPLARKMTNEVRTMSDSQISSLPLKKRKLIDEEERTFKTPKLSHLYENLTLSNVEYGLNLNPQELVKTRTELRNAGLSLILTRQRCPISISSSAKHTELRRTVDENVCHQPSVYNVVRKQSEAASVTLDGTHCRNGHTCGFYDEDYLWCYTDWSNNWDYCCEDDCDFRNKTSYMWCITGNNQRWNYCSQRSSVVAISGNPCLQEHECGLHGESYHWCFTDLNKNWDYCCQPWHPCGYHGEKYKWCYCGRSKKSKWKYCT